MQGWVDLCYVKATGRELNPQPVNRKSNALPLTDHATRTRHAATSSNFGTGRDAKAGTAFNSPQRSVDSNHHQRCSQSSEWGRLERERDISATGINQWTNRTDEGAPDLALSQMMDTSLLCWQLLIPHQLCRQLKNCVSWPKQTTSSSQIRPVPGPYVLPSVRPPFLRTYIKPTSY